MAYNDEFLEGILNAKQKAKKQVANVAKKVSSSSQEINDLFGKTKDFGTEFAKRGGKASKQAGKVLSKASKLPVAKLGAGLGAITNLSSGIGNFQQGRTARGILDALQTAGYTSALVAPNPVTGALALIAGATDLAELGYDKLKSKNKKQGTTSTQSYQTPTTQSSSQLLQDKLLPIEEAKIQGVGVGSVPSNIPNADYRTGNIGNMINDLTRQNNSDYTSQNVQPEQEKYTNTTSTQEQSQQMFDNMLARYQASNQQRQDIYQAELDYLQKLIDNANYVNQWQQINTNVASGLAGIAGNRAIYDSAVANNPMKYLLEKEGLIGKQAQLRDELRFDPNQVLANAEFTSSMGYNPMMALASKDILNAIATAGKLEQQQKYQQALIDLKNLEAQNKVRRQEIEDKRWEKEYALKEREVTAKEKQKDGGIDYKEIININGRTYNVKGLTPHDRNEISSNSAIINSLNEGLKVIANNPNAFGLKGAAPAILQSQKGFGTPAGKEARSRIGALGKEYKKYLTGVASNKTEEKEFARYVPAPYDDADTLTSKLNSIKKIAEDKNKGILGTYYYEEVTNMPTNYNVNDIVQKLYNAGYSQEKINEYLIQKGLK